MREAVQGLYRLRPDARFVRAIADVHRILSGEPEHQLKVWYRAGTWDVWYGRELVGTLPQTPDFADGEKLVQDWTALMLERFPLSSSPGASIPDSVRWRVHDLSTTNLAAALRQLDAAWRNNQRSAGHVTIAAHALTGLALQQIDEVEIFEGVSSSALATSAIAAALGGDTRADRALLANTMGYSRAAAVLSERLAPDDPVRMYLHRDYAALAAHSAGNKATPLSRYLMLTRLAETDREAEWLDRLPASSNAGGDRWWRLFELTLRSRGNLVRAVQEFSRQRSPALTIGTLKTALETGTYADGGYVALMLAPVVLYDLWESAGLRDRPADIHADLRSDRRSATAWRMEKHLGASTDLGLDKVIARFDDDLPALNTLYPGPFLPAATYGGFLSNAMYTAVFTVCRAEGNVTSLVNPSRRLVSGLANASGVVPGHLQKLCEDMLASENRTADPQQVLQRFGELNLIGVPAIIHVYDEVRDQVPYASVAMPQAAAALARRMDSRPSHRYELALISSADLHDVSQATDLYQSLAAHSTSFPWADVQLADAVGDTDRLLQIAADTAALLWLRGSTLDVIIRNGTVPDARIRAQFADMLTQYRDNWDLHDDYIHYLERKEAYAAAEEVVLKWLAAHPRNAGVLGHDHLALARIYYKQARYDEALDAVAPAMRTRTAASMGRRALILLRLGRLNEAETFARRLVDNYGELAWARADLAQVLWERGKFGEVAEVLQPADVTFMAWDWRTEIGDAFLDAFANRQEDAKRAFDALVDASIAPANLQSLTMKVAQRGKHELAFYMQSRLPASPGTWGTIDHAIATHRYLRAWKGDAAADLWLREALPPEFGDRASMLFYRDREYELLWTYNERPAQDTSTEMVWLLRAAAYALRSESSEFRKNQLVEHFRTAPETPHGTYGRYLLGLADEQQMLLLATAPASRTEVAYYLGVKAYADGDFREAARWWRVVMELQATTEGEYHWAFDALRRWSDAGKLKSFTKVVEEP